MEGDGGEEMEVMEWRGGDEVMEWRGGDEVMEWRGGDGRNGM